MTIDEIIDFIVRILEENGITNIDKRPNLPFYDLFLLPAATILKPIMDELDELRNLQSLLSILESEDPEAFNEDLVDYLLGNLFVTREPGDTSTGTVFLQMEAQTVNISPNSLSFFSQSGLQFQNSATIDISAEDISTYLVNGIFTIPISVQAVDIGTEYNISPQSDPIDSYSGYVFDSDVTIIHDQSFSGGVSKQTNASVIQAAKQAISLRSLVISGAIQTVIRERFNYVSDIAVVGFKDPEMMRDVFYNIHVGAHVDIYVKGNGLISYTETFTAVFADRSRRIDQVSFAGFDPIDDLPKRASLGSGYIDNTDRDPVITDALEDFDYTSGEHYRFEDQAGNSLYEVGEIEAIPENSIILDARRDIGGICIMEEATDGSPVVRLPGTIWADINGISRGCAFVVIEAKASDPPNDPVPLAHGAYYIDEIGYSGDANLLKLYYDTEKTGGRKRLFDESLGDLSIESFAIFKDKISIINRTTTISAVNDHYIMDFSQDNPLTDILSIGMKIKEPGDAWSGRVIDIRSGKLILETDAPPENGDFWVESSDLGGSPFATGTIDSAPVSLPNGTGKLFTGESFYRDIERVDVVGTNTMRMYFSSATSLNGIVLGGLIQTRSFDSTVNGNNLSEDTEVIGFKNTGSVKYIEVKNINAVAVAAATIYDASVPVQASGTGFLIIETTNPNPYNPNDKVIIGGTPPDVNGIFGTKIITDVIDSTHFKIAGNYSGTQNITTQKVGAGTLSYRSSRNIFGDASIDFIKEGVKVGDILEITSPAGLARSTVIVSVGPYFSEDTDPDGRVYGVLLKLRDSFDVPGDTIRYKIIGRVRGDYDFNPVSIDIQRTPRTDRSLFTITNVPVIKIDRIRNLTTSRDIFGQQGYSEGSYSDGEYGAGVYDYFERPLKPIFRFSPKEEGIIVINLEEGNDYEITYRADPRLQEIQDFLESDSQNNKCADQLVRHFIPVFISFEANIDISRTTEGAPIEDELITHAENLVEFFRNYFLYLTKKKIEVSDLVNILYDQGKASSVDLPLVVSAEIHNTDGSVDIISSDNVINPEYPEMESYSEKILSNNIARFFLDTAVINITLID